MTAQSKPTQMPSLETMALGAGGTLLAAYGLATTGPMRKLLCLGLGSALIYEAYQRVTLSGGEEKGSSAEAPENGTRPSRGWDDVDEASWESFPASDPPAH